MESVPHVDDDRYQVEAKVGEGAIATVWKALDRVTGQLVAIKLMRINRMLPETVQRLAQEVEVLRRLQHPNIVGVVGAGTAQDTGAPYIVLEWLDNVSLRFYLQRRRQPHPSFILNIVSGVAHAMSAAHEIGVVHRDLKPENVLLCGPDRNHVKVVDFGMAKLPMELARLVTLRSTLFGTPQYMAPERAKGQPVTPATDVYALGIITYEMFAGQRPFEADEASTLLRKHVYEPVPPLPSVSPAVETVLLEALSKNPMQRPSAQRFAIDLQKALCSSSE
ncbi:MAG TPA: serine/threonine-protein kinase [Polyangiaceae bacterium]|jgi:serine/threonine-protein kinase|nr:MAG: Serine/threonine-protein kinase PK-1 [Deltaproteobacteria bacterium ADurb.Bin207]HNS96863.1 serine/threonine-protein kinase [Polyangiaceae bacterium]HNZ20984.1 serine/threonine-protein kinase [Polyangiaceae bacterium]HOD23867.1 serine/threonine-protein kinase [Polyangiaceae bacterium]HOE48854.1 serine/threonine-protein kinase [Polyangiaceae bacterium]